MRTAESESDILRRLLAEARAVLLDFDGPVCSIFAGLPAPTIAAELRGILAAYGAPMPPAELADDPHQVLCHAATISRDLAHQVEVHLAAREIEAAATAGPTPGGHEFIRAWHATGRPLAIVSNNAEPAIHTYLDRHDLAPCVDHVEGRDPSDPRLMKPHPHLIKITCAGLALSPPQCVLVGDSITDVEVGKATGTPVIAYANKPGKPLRFAAWQPAAIVFGMVELESALFPQDDL